MTSETAALSSFENAVTHICAYCDIESDYGYHVSEFTVRKISKKKSTIPPILSATNFSSSFLDLLYSLQLVII